MDLLFNSLEKLCLTQGFEKTYWVGFSGGLDSHVLLHLFSRLKFSYPIKIVAVYVNHGLSPSAADWATHAANVCHELNIEFQSFAINVRGVRSIEAQAREQRYHIFAECLKEKDILLTAHHQDDQAETVLIQMLRGSGPKGLAAMPRLKLFAKGFHARPLLDFTRAQLHHYAEHHQLHWIDDESNTNVKFVRNFLRHEILPLLKNRWPSATNTLARVADHCAEMQALLDEVIQHDLNKTKGEARNTLSVQALLELNPVRQRHVLRAWLVSQHFPIPSSAKLQQIQQDMLSAKEDKMPYFTWQGIELRRFRDNLYTMVCLGEHDSSQIIPWDLAQPLYLPGIGILSAKQVDGQGMRIDISKVSIRFRQGGEVLRLSGRRGSRTLKKLFQEWNVPFWERDRLPLVYVESKLAAVVGYGIQEEFLVKSNETGYVLHWKMIG